MHRLSTLFAFIAIKHQRVSAFFFFSFLLAFSLWKCTDFVVTLKWLSNISTVSMSLSHRIFFLGDVRALCLVFLWWLRRRRAWLCGDPSAALSSPGVHCGRFIHASLNSARAAKCRLPGAGRAFLKPPPPPPLQWFRNIAFVLFVLCPSLEIAEPFRRLPGFPPIPGEPPPALVVGGGTAPSRAPWTPLAPLIPPPARCPANRPDKQVMHWQGADGLPPR